MCQLIQRNHMFCRLIPYYVALNPDLFPLPHLEVEPELSWKVHSRRAVLIVHLIDFVLSRLLRLLLLRSQPTDNRVQHITRNLQLCAHHRLGRVNDALALNLAGLILVCAEHIPLAILSNLEGEEDHVEHRSLDLLSVLFHDGELVVDGFETGIAELVGLRDVRCYP